MVLNIGRKIQKSKNRINDKTDENLPKTVDIPKDVEKRDNRSSLRGRPTNRSPRRTRSSSKQRGYLHRGRNDIRSKSRSRGLKHEGHSKGTTKRSSSRNRGKNVTTSKVTRTYLNSTNRSTSPQRRRASPSRHRMSPSIPKIYHQGVKSDLKVEKSSDVGTPTIHRPPIQKRQNEGTKDGQEKITPTISFHGINISKPFDDEHSFVTNSSSVTPKINNLSVPCKEQAADQQSLHSF